MAIVGQEILHLVQMLTVKAIDYDTDKKDIRQAG